MLWRQSPRSVASFKSPGWDASQSVVITTGAPRCWLSNRTPFGFCQPEARPRGTLGMPCHAPDRPTNHGGVPVHHTWPERPRGVGQNGRIRQGKQFWSSGKWVDLLTETWLYHLADCCEHVSSLVVWKRWLYCVKRLCKLPVPWIAIESKSLGFHGRTNWQKAPHVTTKLWNDLLTDFATTDLPTLVSLNWFVS